jgi:hypothetical protein
MYGPIKKIAKQSGYTENNAGPKGLTEAQKTLPINLQKAISKSKGFMRMEDGLEAPDGPAKGFPRFCGGMSKPYKK